jgi:hypothetical protein
VVIQWEMVVIRADSQPLVTGLPTSGRQAAG